MLDWGLKEELIRLRAELKAKEEFCRHLEESIRIRDERLMALLDPAAYTQFKRYNNAQRVPVELTEHEIKLRDKRAQEVKDEVEELTNLGIL